MIGVNFLYYEHRTGKPKTFFMQKLEHLLSFIEYEHACDYSEVKYWYFGQLFVFTDSVSSFDIPALSPLPTIVALYNNYHTL